MAMQPKYDGGWSGNPCNIVPRCEDFVKLILGAVYRRINIMEHGHALEAGVEQTWLNRNLTQGGETPIVDIREDSNSQELEVPAQEQTETWPTGTPNAAGGRPGSRLLL